MADIDILPQDVIDELKAAGVKFDENGNIIDEVITPDEDIQDDSQTDSGESDQEDTDSEADDEADEDDDEVEEEVSPVKTKAIKADLAEKRMKLTRRADPIDENNAELLALRKEKKDLEDQLAALLKDNEETPEDAIKKEAMKFKHLRLREFKNSVSRSVDDLDLGANFNDIISSEEWPTYLNTKMFGSKVSDMLRNAIEESNLDDVISFYTDFANRYLPTLAKTKVPSAPVKKLIKKANAESLSDLATPNKTQVDRKTSVDPSRKTFLYNESDYEVMLTKAERGQLPYDDFVKFETKFDAARRAGRVKSSV
jgi:hypothetical protein